MLITGAGGFAGYHLIAAGLASDSEVFVAASPVSMIKRASGMTRKKNSLQYDAVNAGCAKTEIAQLHKLHLKSLKL
jgi:nucleoside-diphosphate-sugar epimerase